MAHTLRRHRLRRAAMAALTLAAGILIVTPASPAAADGWTFRTALYKNDGDAGGISTKIWAYYNGILQVEGGFAAYDEVLAVRSIKGVGAATVRVYVYKDLGADPVGHSACGVLSTSALNRCDWSSAEGLPTRVTLELFRSRSDTEPFLVKNKWGGRS